MTPTASLHCGNCPHYLGEPAALESALPGLNILSSAFGSVRDETGLCRRFEIFVVSNAACIADARGDASGGCAERR
jgi:hypothetical protein